MFCRIYLYGIYFICCIGDYLSIVKDQLRKLSKSGLYSQTDILLCFICNETPEIIDILNQYSKIKIISTKENLYERFAINNFKNYLSGDYNLYYIHSKSVSRTEKCCTDWRNLCDYFTIYKWQLNIELLNYYDCIGTNLKNFPKKHYSGNFWWSKSDHVKKLKNINYGYLSPEMYIFSYMKTNYISIYQSFVNHGDTEHPEELYINKSDDELLNNLCLVPDFNNGDKKCISMCGEIDIMNEPPILEID